ncbi:phage tail tape measure protein [Candidatus Pacearchaeota archaeon]|nr:phage tail tape measure protein [Candidatus Pacearchaeota archaeon]
MSNFNISYLYSLRDKFSGKLKRINRITTIHAKRLKRSTQELSVLKHSYKRFALVATAAITGAIIANAKFEKGLANVLGLLDTDVAKQFKGQLESLQEEAVKLGFGLQDSNKALFDTISALGLSTNSMQAFRIAQKLSIAGNAELSSSVLGLSKVMNIYGRETTNADLVANAFFSAQKAGTTTVQELADNYGKVGGAAKFAGLGFEETLATMAVLTNTLKNTEEASTAMAAVLKAVTNPAKEQKKIMTALGITTGVTAVQQRGFGAVLLEVSKAMKQYPDAVARAIPEMRALKGITSLTDESLKLIGTTTKQIAIDQKTGAGMMTSYARNMDTVNQKFRQTRGLITVVAKKYGDDLNPATKTALNITNKLLGATTNLSKVQRKAGFVGALPAAAGGVFKDLLGLGSAGDSLLNNVGTNNGKFDANINLNAPKGTVGSVKTREKKATGFNLGLNMQEA